MVMSLTARLRAVRTYIECYRKCRNQNKLDNQT